MATPSLKKTVEIALQITNADPEHIKNIASAFGSINTAVKNAAANLKTFKENLNDIKYPPKLDKFVAAFSTLGNLKLPNLVNIAEGFERLEKIKIPVDLTRFADELRKFEGIKLPNLANIAQGFAKLAEIQSPADLTAFITELKKFEGIKLPNFNSIAQGFAKLDAIKISPDLTSFVTELKKFEGIKVPNFNSIAQGFAKFDAIRVPPDLSKFATELKQFEGIKIPNFNAIAQGFAKFDTIKNPVNLTKFAEELKKFEGITLPNVTNVSNGLKGISESTANMTAVGTRLQSLVKNLKDFTEIKIPNLNSLAVGLKNLSAQSIDASFAPKMNQLARELRRFSDIKLPNVASIASGFQKLIALDVQQVIAQIRALNTALFNLNRTGGTNAFAVFAQQAAGLQTAFKSAASSTTQLVNAIRSTGQAVDVGGLKLDTWANKIRTVFQFRIISAGIVQMQQGLREAITSIFDYDQALKDLQAITGSTDLEVAMMGETIKKVASTTKFSAQEVAEGMRIISQAGFTAGESIQTMQAVSDLATGTLSSMSTTVDLVTTALRVFNIDASESARVADVFANAVNGSKLDIEKLNTAMNYVGPIAKDAGISFEDLSAAMMTLSNSGIRASTIGTGLRQVISELVDPSDKLREASDKVGIALADLNPETSSLQDVISNLGLVVSDTSTAFDIFGKRGASAVLALISENSQYSKMVEMVGTTGTAAKQAAKQMEGLAVQFKNLKDKLGLLAIALGDGFIVDTFKVLLSTGRALTDFFILLSSTLTGKLVVAFGAVTVALLSFSVAWGGLTVIASTQLFIGMALGVARFASMMSLATSGVGAFIASLGPLGLTISFISVMMLLLAGRTKETAADMQALALEYSALSKKFQDYSVSIVGLKEGSEGLKTANLGMRKSLLEVSTSMSGVSQEALLAANSIDPLTGEIDKQSTALADYNAKLEAIHLSKFAESANVINGQLEKSGTLFNRTINTIWTNLQNAPVFNFGFRESAIEADLFAKKLSEGNVSLKETKNLIDSWDSTKLTTQQEVIKNNYELLLEKANLFAADLISLGKVDLSSTSDEFAKAAEKAGYTGIVLKAIIETLEKLKAKAKVPYTNMIEKWAHDGIDSVIEFADEYEKLQGAFGEGEKEGMLLSRAKKADLMLGLKFLKDIQKAEEASGMDRFKSLEKFERDKAALLEAANKVQAEDSRNVAVQNMEQILQAREKLVNELKTIDVKQAKNEEERAHQRQMAISAYAKKEALLLKGSATDPKEQTRLYETDLEDRKAMHENHLAEIAILEAKGVYTHGQAEQKKNDATIKMYEESYVRAKKYFQEVENIEDPSSAVYTKRKAAMLNAEKDYYAQLSIIVKDYNKAVSKKDKAIIKSTEDAADKMLKVEKKLQEDLEALALKRKEKDRTVAAERITIEADGADAIRKINQIGMSEDNKMYSDRDAAYQKIADATKLISEAGSAGDLQKLKAGEALIKQAQTMGQGLANQAMAIDLVEQSTAALLKAKDSEKEINDLETIRLKNVEIAETVKKRKEIETEKETAIQAANDLFSAEMGWEDIRSETVKSNLQEEIEMYQKKLQIAKDIATVSRNTSSESSSSSSETPTGYATGGSVFKRLSSPLITTGSSTRDSVRALLMKGEFVQPIATVKKYGVRFMEMLRRGMVPVKEASRFAMGGIVNPDMVNSIRNIVNNSPVQKFATGGGVGMFNTNLNSSKAPNAMTLNFAFGNKIYPVSTSPSIASGLIGELKKMQRNMV